MIQRSGYASGRFVKRIGLTGGIVFAALVWAVSASAAGLMDIYGQAVHNDPTFQSYQFKTLIADEGKRQALAEMLPSLVGTAGYTQKNQDIISSDNSVYGQGKSEYGVKTYAITLTQPLFHWASIVGMQEADMVRMRAQLEYVLAGQELMIRVADLYFEALAAKDQLDYALIEETAVAKHHELAQGRSDMGLIPITDLRDAEARLAATQAQTIDARNKYDDALQALSEVTGTSVDTLVALKPALDLRGPEPAQIETWLQGARTQNPAIELYKKSIEIAELEVKRQNAAHYPTVDLVGSYDDDDSEGSLFGGSSDVATLKAGVQLTVPFYQGGAVSSKVRSAEHQVRIANQELLKQSRSVERKTRSAFLGVSSSLKRVDALQQSVEANRLALEAKQDGYMSGLYDSLSVLDAERDLALAHIDYSRARYDYILNSLRLKQAVGSLSENDLRELERWFVK